MTSSYEAASKQFGAAVEAASDTQGLLEAIEQYQSAVSMAADTMRKMSPPILYRRSHERFVGNLEVLKTGLAEMASALKSEDAATTQAASDKLESISAGNKQMAAQIHADREADYKDFNARIDEIKLLMERVRQDQAELRQKLERN